MEFTNENESEAEIVLRLLHQGKWHEELLSIELFKTIHDRILSPHERLVLARMVELREKGFNQTRSYRIIARELNIKVETIQSYASNVKKKYRVKMNTSPEQQLKKYLTGRKKYVRKRRQEQIVVGELQEEPREDIRE